MLDSIIIHIFTVQYYTPSAVDKRLSIDSDILDKPKEFVPLHHTYSLTALFIINISKLIMFVCTMVQDFFVQFDKFFLHTSGRTCCVKHHCMYICVCVCLFVLSMQCYHTRSSYEVSQNTYTVTLPPFVRA